MFYTYLAHVFVISTVALNERLIRLKVLALAVAIVGVVLIVGTNPTEVNPVGIGLVLLAAIGYGAYTTASRATLTTVDSATLTANAMVATTVSMLPFGVLSGNLSIPTETHQWLIVLGIGLVGTTVPIVLFIRGLDRIEASHASIIGTSEPLVTVLLGVVLLGDHLTTVLLIGGAFVLGGMFLIQLDGQISTAQYFPHATRTRYGHSVLSLRPENTRRTGTSGPTTVNRPCGEITLSDNECYHR